MDILKNAHIPIVLLTGKIVWFILWYECSMKRWYHAEDS